MEKKILYLTFNQAGVHITKNRAVGIWFDAPSDATGLAPHLIPGIEMSPKEARDIARLLLKKADEAEAIPKQ